MSVIHLLGLDIGGSFIKAIYACPSTCDNLPDYVIRDNHLDGVPVNGTPGNEIHFVKIPTNRTIEFCEYMRKLDDKKLIVHSKAGITGGGAYKYQAELASLAITCQKRDEIGSLIVGLNYALTRFHGEVFTYGWRDKAAGYCDMTTDPIYPYLLVNIGSGVSIIKVSGEKAYERLTGTSLGGATFWGMAKLLTGVTNFGDIEGMSDDGNNKNVDLLVEDIYGGNYDVIGLPGYVIASNFGKVGSGMVQQPSREDIIKSLLYMFADNICQIAYLAIRNDNTIRNIFFTGSFTNIGPVLWKKLSYGIEFWSGGKMLAKFLKHEGYFGAIGACMD